MIKLCLLCICLFLTGCTGIFEAETCGIKNTKWQSLSLAEKCEIEKVHYESGQQNQLRVKQLLAKQQQKSIDDLDSMRKNSEGITKIDGSTIKLGRPPLLISN